MGSTIPDNFRDLFDKKAFAQLATIMQDGTPHVTPVWVDFDGTHVSIAEGASAPRRSSKGILF